MPTFVRVAFVSELEPGKVRQFTVNGTTIALCNVDGNFYALDNFCLHRGGPLGEGFLEGEKVECPWHGWQFNVKTGCKIMNPEMKVAIFEVRVEGADVLIGI